MGDLLLVTSGGLLSRRARLYIQYAPTGMVIKVKSMTSKISGYSVDKVIIDDPLAELTGGKDE